jgi:hypothetical protein
MLWLGCSWCFFLVIGLNLLGFWLGSFLLCLLLCLLLRCCVLGLRWCLVLESGLGKLDGRSNGGVDGLAVDGLVPTADVGVLLTPFLIEEVLETADEESNSEEIGKG